MDKGELSPLFFISPPSKPAGHTLSGTGHTTETPFKLTRPPEKHPPKFDPDRNQRPAKENIISDKPGAYRQPHIKPEFQPGTPIHKRNHHYGRQHPE